MNTDINYTEDYFATCLQNDKLPFEVDPAIRQRLLYALSVRKNSNNTGSLKISAATKRFSVSRFSYKVGMALAASLLLFLLLRITINQPNQSSSPIISDSSFCDSVNIRFYSGTDSCVKFR